MSFFALPASPSVAATTGSFGFTGEAQSWTVPDGVTEVSFDLLGAQGAGSSFGPAGLGGFAAVTISVVPGQTLQINVGGAGSGSTGGFNGGANGRTSGASSSGGGGGGASDVRTGSFGLDDRIVVAGGGGGGGNSRSFNPYRESFGGAGGGARGGDGGGVGRFPEPGTGGTQTAGGSCQGFDCGGTFGAGGAGAGGGVSNGGGGGGGWWGGGGGASGNGGGGGSGYGPEDTVFQSGVGSGNGIVSVSYEVEPAPTPDPTPDPTPTPFPPSPILSLSFNAPSKVTSGKTFGMKVRVTNDTNEAVVGRFASVRAASEAVSAKTCLEVPRPLVITRARGAKISGRTACWYRSSLGSGKSASYPVTVSSPRSANGSKLLVVSVRGCTSNCAGFSVNWAGAQIKVVRGKRSGVTG